jgi:hypothetical protein
MDCARARTRGFRRSTAVGSANPCLERPPGVRPADAGGGGEPASPGFGSVGSAPYLGDLREVPAKFPHAQGMIKVHFERAGNALTGTVTFPWAAGRLRVEGETAGVAQRRQLDCGHPFVTVV